MQKYQAYLDKLYIEKAIYKITKAILVDVIYSQIYYNCSNLFEKYTTAQVM